MLMICLRGCEVTSVKEALDMAKKDLSLLREGKMPLHTGEIVEALESADSKEEISINDWTSLREFVWRETLLFLLESYACDRVSALAALKDIMKEWDASFPKPGGGCDGR